jgi:hypothetical protein
MMQLAVWEKERYPVVYEGDQPKAIMVDIDSFAQIELILDNLLNRETEPEDAILAASAALKRLVERARAEEPSPDWEAELDAL